VLAAYASGVARNGLLPANIGTFVMLLMFIAIIPGADLPGVLGGMLVQKIFFTLAGAFVYIYLFASVPGTFERQFELLHDRPGLVLAIVAGAVVLIVVLLRVFRRKLPGLIERAKQGGTILVRQRRIGHAGRGWRQPGDQRGGSQRRDGRRHRDRVLARPAARCHRLEHRLRGRARHLGVRLGRREDARRALVRGRQGEGRRAEGQAGGGPG
jgi:hypothetical protein